MNALGSSTLNSNSEDCLGNQPLLKSVPGKSAPGESNELSSEERSKHFSSPKISIGHVYVYNFSPSTQPVDTIIEFPTPTEAIVKTKQVVISPTASSEPFCRICHEGDAHEDLLSPCHCTGTVGLVHISCIEKWLGASGSDMCEICHYAFTTVRYPKSCTEWLRSSSSSSGQRTLWGDITCFLMLTPLAAVSGFLSIDGALKHVRSRNSVEAGCLMALATFLVTVYFIWSILTFRYHLRKFLSWRQKNHRVKILLQRRLSSTDGHYLSIRRPCDNRHFITSPRTHQQTPIRQSQIPVNSSEAASTAANEIHNNADRTFTHTEYDFNRSEFVEHLAAVLETAL